MCIYIYIYILFHILFLYGLSEDIEYISLCYTVGPSVIFVQLKLLIKHLLVSNAKPGTVQSWVLSHRACTSGRAIK